MIAHSPRCARACLVAVLSIFALQKAAAQDFDSPNPIKAIDSATLKGFLERPLFDPTRRVPPVAPPLVPMAEAPVDADQSVVPPALQLLGVIHGKRDIAVVHRDGGDKTIILHTGDHVDGWTVTVRPPVGIRLRNGARGFDYAMFGTPGRNPGPVAVETGTPGVRAEAMAKTNAR